MAVKAQSESQARGRGGRRREVLGIVLLACGLFAGLSLVAMHAGDNQMMGPGGAETAAVRAETPDDVVQRLAEGMQKVMASSAAQ